MIGLNYAEGSFLRMLLKDRRMEKGAFIGKANGTMYPMDQIPAEKYKLPTFAGLIIFVHEIRKIYLNGGERRLVSKCRNQTGNL